ncbi:hypothetical protein ASG29_15600 [Sphingomonas sp. Leaf412]|uniref:CatB-related O-acetyltransferase n=1 Tax=Sphingomonas sp. Leaf412 TaxID=1736370 RepID=UPI0006F65614|nr:hypothetical protein ASG29_15600 [Sphingomonas sp. Leaf412]
MIGKIVRKVRERIEMTLLRPQQATSERLRRIFRDRHDIDVGRYSYGCFDQWRMPGPIRVGRWCSIANSVRSAPTNHPLEAMTTHPALYERQFGVVAQEGLHGAPLVIGDDVWIGHNAILLPGCKSVGRGAVIGAGAIVTRDVPAYTIVAGNPAKELRRRFPDDLIAALEDSRWWTLDAPALRDLVATRPDLAYHPTAAAVTEWTRTRAAKGRTDG